MEDIQWPSTLSLQNLEVFELCYLIQYPMTDIIHNCMLCLLYHAILFKNKRFFTVGVLFFCLFIFLHERVTFISVFHVL